MREVGDRLYPPTRDVQLSGAQAGAGNGPLTGRAVPGDSLEPHTPNGEREEETDSEKVFLGIRRTVNNVSVSYTKAKLKRIFPPSEGGVCVMVLRAHAAGLRDARVSRTGGPVNAQMRAPLSAARRPGPLLCGVLPSPAASVPMVRWFVP